MNKFKLVFLFFVVSCCYYCSDSQTNEDNDIAIINDTNPGASSVNPGSTNNNPVNTDDLSDTDFNILFVGNSLTYTNDLPELVKQNALLKGIIVGTKMIAEPNTAIIDHWIGGKVQVEIASKQFDFVVIQQGPSSQAYGREVLIDYGKKYADLCNENDVKLAYYMVWPSIGWYHTFDDVIRNHRDAAAINEAILCPVGEKWKAHFDLTNNFDYYGPDNFHPSLLGSQVAANIIVESLFARQRDN